MPNVLNDFLEALDCERQIDLELIRLYYEEVSKDIYSTEFEDNPLLPAENIRENWINYGLLISLIINKEPLSREDRILHACGVCASLFNLKNPKEQELFSIFDCVSCLVPLDKFKFMLMGQCETSRIKEDNNHVLAKVLSKSKEVF